MVSLTNQLHIAILDAVMHHLYVMPSAILSNPVAARGPIVHLCCDRLEDFFHVRPCFLISTRHNRRTEPSALFSARNASPDEKNPFCGQFLRSPARIGI